MLELLTNFPFLVFASITITCVVAALATAWGQYNKTATESNLKILMLQRGLPAEEIERILHASADNPPKGPPPEVSGLDTEALNALVSALSTSRAPAGTIEQVLTAFRAADPVTQRAISESVVTYLDNLEDYLEDGSPVVAIVRSLCQPRDKPTVPFPRSEAFHG